MNPRFVMKSSLGLVHFYPENISYYNDFLKTMLLATFIHVE